MLEHQAGHGAALTAAALAAGCELHVARLWHNATFWFEAQIKKASHLHRLCPICSVDLDVPIETRFPPLVAPAPPTSRSSGWTTGLAWPDRGEPAQRRSSSRKRGNG